MLRRIGGSIGVVVLLVAGAGFWVWDKVNGNDSENDKAGGIGDCLAVEDALVFDDDAEKVACDDATATYVITGEGETNEACDANELYFESTQDDETWVSCLWPNVVKGDCLTADDVPLKVDCGSADAALSVVVADEESADEALCPAGRKNPTQAFVNEKREKLLCLGPVA